MNDLVPGARVQVKVHKGKAMPKSDVLKAAEDITKVIEDGKDDDASVKNIIAGSKTHGGIVPPPPPPHQAHATHTGKQWPWVDGKIRCASPPHREDMCCFWKF